MRFASKFERSPCAAETGGTVRKNIDPMFCGFLNRDCLCPPYGRTKNSGNPGNPDLAHFMKSHGYESRRDGMFSHRKQRHRSDERRNGRDDWI